MQTTRVMEKALQSGRSERGVVIGGCSGFFLSIFASVLTIISIIVQLGCGKSEPIFIGFSGQLSGAYADLGIKGRDGVMLAVEHINAKGGIAGRSLKLIVQDDKGTPEGTLSADKKLIDANVVAIIGHMTSGQTMAALPVVEKAGMVLISPTTSTVELTGRDDFFFRVAATCTTEARILSRHIYKNRNVHRLAVVLDTDNAAYSNAYLDAFSKVFKEAGGDVIGEWRFSSIGKPDFNQIAEDMKTREPDAALIIASPLDTALIAQKIKAVNPLILLFSSAWGQTDAMLQYGGKAVEGIEIILYFDSNSQNPLFRKFSSQYYGKFGHEPSFAGGSGYEAMQVLAAALEKTKGQKAGIREALKEIRDVDGLQGTISMDRYGDVRRTHFLHIVENGKFITKPTIEL